MRACVQAGPGQRREGTTFSLSQPKVLRRQEPCGVRPDLAETSPCLNWVADTLSHPSFSFLSLPFSPLFPPSLSCLPHAPSSSAFCFLHFLSPTPFSPHSSGNTRRKYKELVWWRNEEKKELGHRKAERRRERARQRYRDRKRS